MDEVRAKGEASPLYGRFTWDPDEAHEKLLLREAADLIRSVKITTRDLAPMELRAFIHIPQSAGDDGAQALSSYVPEDEVRTDPVLQAVALGVMDREWRQLKKRWAAYKEFWELVATDLPGEESAA